MTEQEAIIWLEDDIKEIKRDLASGEVSNGYAEEGTEIYKMAISALKEIQQYRKIGTVEECREAVEKQKPKKPHRNYKKFSGLWCKCGWYLGQKQCLDIKYCPKCGKLLDSSFRSFCANCGQRLEDGR